MAAKAAAAQAAAPRPRPATHPITVTVTPSPGSYADPLRGINALTPERIDQGVDYSGYGPIYAIGDGVVLSTVNGGWPGETFISYRLSDGPAAGLAVYAAEDIDPHGHRGPIGDGGDSSRHHVRGSGRHRDGLGRSVGRRHQHGQRRRPVLGRQLDRLRGERLKLLASLGAPPGVAQNDPPTGDLPPGWPTW